MKVNQLVKCKNCDGKTFFVRDCSIDTTGLPSKVRKLIHKGKIRPFQCRKCYTWYLISDDDEIFYFFDGWKPWKVSKTFIFR